MKILIKTLIVLPLLTPNLGLAMENLEEIGLSSSRAKLELVENGKVKTQCLKLFLKETGVNKNIQNWSSFKESLTTKKMKGIAGEAAAKFFFGKLGYQTLDSHYNNRLDFLRSDPLNDNIFEDQNCTTKKGPDNGIDGIFFLRNETLKNHSHLIVNEAKLRKNKVDLSTRDFGFVVDGIQQSHSTWNSPRFSWPSCLPDLRYDTEVIIRTATLLNRDGTLRLYEIKDKNNEGTVVGEYSSKAPQSWNIRKIWDRHIASKF